MMLTIWTSVVILYVAFYCWYIGFRKKVTSTEIDSLMERFTSADKVTDKQQENVRSFFVNDDGKDFVMINLLHLRHPLKESREKLSKYQKVFLGQLLIKAGHPIMIGRAASGNIENLACEQADDWTAFGIVRYRSRRDLLEMLHATIASEHHQLKLDSLQKTLAFPAAPWSMVGGPKWLVPIGLAFAGMVLHLVLI